MMDGMTLAPLPGTFDACKTRVDSIMRELADWHEAKAASGPGFTGLGGFLAARRAAAVEAAVLRAARRH